MCRLTLALLVGLAATPAFAGDIKVINDKAAFPEGPAFVDGKLHYVEYGGNTIDVWDGKTNTVLVEERRLRPVRGAAARRGRSRRHLLRQRHHRPRLARRQDGGDLRQGQGWRRAAGPERPCGRRQGRRLFHGLGSVGIGTDRRQGFSSYRRRHDQRRSPTTCTMPTASCWAPTASGSTSTSRKPAA